MGSVWTDTGTPDYGNKTLLKNAFVAVTVFNIFACFVAKSSVPPPFSFMHRKISCKWRREAAKHCSKKWIKNNGASVCRGNFYIRYWTTLFTSYGINTNWGVSIAFVAILPTSLSHCSSLCSSKASLSNQQLAVVILGKIQLEEKSLAKDKHHEIAGSPVNSSSPQHAY